MRAKRRIQENTPSLISIDEKQHAINARANKAPRPLLSKKEKSMRVKV